ncbi:hypothetical protein CSPX01_08537 [Colletotrichum filicis]|nr:hypothetical protein CSPX01_08537 [Colletotrichum filicis]
MAFDEGQEFEFLTALSEDDYPKLETMSGFQPEPAQHVNFNADALSVDQVYCQMSSELPAGGSDTVDFPIVEKGKETTQTEFEEEDIPLGNDENSWYGVYFCTRPGCDTLFSSPGARR